MLKNSYLHRHFFLLIFWAALWFVVWIQVKEDLSARWAFVYTSTVMLAATWTVYPNKKGKSVSTVWKRMVISTSGSVTAITNIRDMYPQAPRVSDWKMSKGDSSCNMKITIP